MVQTKAGLTLLDNKTLSNLIKTIESNIPGWWWSVSQKAECLRISVGPSAYALLDVDRAMSTLKEKEEFIFNYSATGEGFEGFDKIDPCAWFLSQKQSLIDDARKDVVDKEIAFPPFQGAPRQQTRNARHAFRKIYGEFLRCIPEYENDGGLTIEEIYVGSCELSVDVSIRGKDPEGNSLDCSFDYQSDAILADSMGSAMRDFRRHGKRTKLRAKVA